MHFYGNDMRLDMFGERLLVVSGRVSQFTDRLFVKDVLEPYILMVVFSSFVSESSSAVSAAVRLYSVL
jgi:hypothetical protein